MFEREELTYPLLQKAELQGNRPLSHEAKKYWPKEEPRQKRWETNVFSET